MPFTLPKWITDIKALLASADGKILGRNNSAWEFVDPQSGPPGADGNPGADGLGYQVISLTSINLDTIDFSQATPTWDFELYAPTAYIVGCSVLIKAISMDAKFYGIITAKNGNTISVQIDTFNSYYNGSGNCAAWGVSLIGLQGIQGFGFNYRGTFINNVTYAYMDVVRIYNTNYMYISPVAGHTHYPVEGGDSAYWVRIAINGTNGTNGTSFIWKGVYSTSTYYYAKDVVFFNGSSYTPITGGFSGFDPTDVTRWQLVAQKGATGADGSPGTQGPPGTSDHSQLSNLTTGDPHTQYPHPAGRAGGQTLRGGNAASEALTLRSTAHTTLGKIFFGLVSAFDEALNKLGIGTTSPSGTIHAKSQTGVPAVVIVDTTDTSGAGSPSYYSIRKNAVEKAWFGCGTAGDDTVSFAVTQSNADFGVKVNAGGSTKTPIKVIGASATDDNITVKAGKVGIGNISPAELLDVNGNLHLNGNMAKYLSCHSGYTFPSSPQFGQWFAQTTRNNVCFYNGGWVPVFALSGNTIYVDPVNGTDGSAYGNSGTVWTLTYSSKTGTLTSGTPGEIVRGSVSGAWGTLSSDNGSALTVAHLCGTWVSNDVVTGDTSGKSATLSGVSVSSGAIKTLPWINNLMPAAGNVGTTVILYGGTYPDNFTLTRNNVTLQGVNTGGVRYTITSAVQDAPGTQAVIGTGSTLTADQLKGQILKFTSGNAINNYRVIESNTVTTGGVALITLVGYGSVLGTVNVGDTFEIHPLCTVFAGQLRINSGVVGFIGNDIKFTNSTGYAVRCESSGTSYFQRCRDESFYGTYYNSNSLQLAYNLFCSYYHNANQSYVTKMMIANGSWAWLEGCYFHRGSNGTLAGSVGISVSNNAMASIRNGTTVDGFVYGIYASTYSRVQVSGSTALLLFKNLSYGLSATDGSTIIANTSYYSCTNVTVPRYAETDSCSYVTGAVPSITTDFIIGTAGKGLRIKEGSNARMGVSTLVAGTVTVGNTSVTASTRIQLTVQSLGTVTTPKAIGVTARVNGTSFTITSADNTDTSIIAWELKEPA